MEELQDDEKSEYVKDVLSRMPNGAGRYGIWIVCIILTSFFIILKLINYPEVISANIEIVSKSTSVDIKPQISGRYVSIVDKNDLIRVDSAQILGYIYSPLDIGIVLSLKDDLEHLHTSEIIEKFSGNYLAELQSDYNEYKKCFIDKSNYTNYRPDSRQKISYSNQVASLTKTIASKEKELSLIGEQLKLIEKDLARYKLLYEKSVISSQEYDNMQRNYITLKRERENLESSYNESMSTLMALKGSMIQSEISDNIGIENKEDLFIASKNKLMTSLIKWIDDHIIYAPFSGELGSFKSLAKLSNVTPNDVIYVLSPEEIEAPYGLATISNINAGKIKVGQAVNITLRDFPVNEFGWLKGTIRNISMSKRDNSYIAFVELNSQITTHNKKVELKPEISGTVDIITKDYSLFDRFFFGIKKVFIQRLAK